MTLKGSIEIRKENKMEYLVGFNYSGRVTYEIEADDEETAPSLRMRILSMTL